MHYKTASHQILNNLYSTNKALSETKRNLLEIKSFLSTYKDKKSSKFKNALWNYNDMKASYKTLLKVRNIIFRKLFVCKLKDFI